MRGSQISQKDVDPTCDGDKNLKVSSFYRIIPTENALYCVILSNNRA